MELTPGLFIVTSVIALFCQYLSVSIGVGYGTIVTPLLLTIGFMPLQIVPVVLLSQLAGGIIGGIFHHRSGNITLDFRRDDRISEGRLLSLGSYLPMPRSVDSKVIFVLGVCGVIGVLIGVITAVSISMVALEAYIGVIVLGIGLTVILRRSKKGKLSWKGLVVLGLLSAFNKGISGGGYVPLVTSGQIISGRETRSSVGSTTVAVAIVCVVGFISYLFFSREIDWILAAASAIGSIIAAPFAALTIKKTSTYRLKLVIGIATITLGILTLVKTFAF